MSKSDKESPSTLVPAPLAMPFDLAALVTGGLPALMGDALHRAPGSEFDPDLGDAGGPKLPFIAIPQANSRKYLKNTLGEVWLGAKTDNIQDAGNYKEAISFLLIDSLVIRPKTGRGRGTGGRLMWSFNPDGTRNLEDGVSCQSMNGIAPVTRYLGTEFVDFRTGEQVKVGFQRNPNGTWQPMPDTNICARCPAKDWITLSNGRAVQLCKDNWGWVLGVIEGDDVRMAKMSGGNSGVQMALTGRNPGATGCRADGAALPGVEYFFRRSGERDVEIPASTTLSDAQLEMVAGVKLVYEGQEIEAAAAALLPQADGSFVRNEHFFALLQSDAVKAVKLKVPTYPYAPEGRPEHTGTNTPVYPVILTVTENNFNPATYVPDFRLGDTPLTEQQYAAFLGVKAEYANEGMREYFLGMGLMDDVAARLRDATPPTISVSAPAPELPASVGEHGDVVVEATIIDDNPPFDV